MSSAAWPYPRWIAHRGAGTLAPENTVAALRLGAAHGYRMAECDVKLSADGVPFLLHDNTLERTTNGHGVAGELAWQALARLDAGYWHSKAFAGEPLPTLSDAAACCASTGLLLNIEIKPTPGQETITGHATALAARQLWKDAPVPPLLTSFQMTCLAAAQSAAPELPRGLLVSKSSDDWLVQAKALGCVAVVCHHPLWSERQIQACHEAGVRALAYTVNDPRQVDRLLSWGLDGLITDRVDLFKPQGDGAFNAVARRPECPGRQPETSR